MMVMINIGYIFISPVEDRMTGLSSYTKSLLIELATHATDAGDIKLHVLTNSREIIDFINSQKNFQHSVELSECKRRKYIPYKLWCLWTHLTYNVISSLFGKNLIISTTPWGSILPIIPQIITIHDLYDLNPAYRPKRTVIFSKLMYKLLSKVGSNFICVSETTSLIAKKQLPFIRDIKKEVILEASKFTFAEAISSSTQKPNVDSYFIFVANLQTNKNPAILWDAMKMVETKIKWSIKWIGWDEQGLMLSYKKEMKEDIQKNFIPIGRVSDQELSILYSGALALIVTSLDEGFCLPVVEAHSHSCPVIASNIPILREIAGEGADFFDLNNPIELAKILTEFIENPKKHQEFSEKARKNSTRFSWKKTSNQTLDYARRILKK